MWLALTPSVTIFWPAKDDSIGTLTIHENRFPAPMTVAIIVNYLASNLAIHAVQSLLRSNPAEALDIWLVDNSVSTTEAQHLHDHVGHRCHIVINAENVGFGKACNQIYQRTQSRWVLLLNPDARLEPDALSSMRRFMEHTPQAAAVGPLVYWDDERTFLLPPSLPPSPWQDFLGRPRGVFRASLTWWSSLRQRARAIRYWTSTEPLPQQNLSGGHVLLRRTAVDKAGGLFDPRFFLYYEDTDLFLRMRRAGYRLFALPKARGIHSFNACARDQQAWKNQHMAQSHRQFISKHFGDSKGTRILDKLNGLSPPKTWRPQSHNLGTLATPPTLEVPSRWQHKWLMECSPNPYFFPAAGHFGRGREAVFPPSIWPLLLPGASFLRLGPGDGFWVSPHVWQWRSMDG